LADTAIDFHTAYQNTVTHVLRLAATADGGQLTVYGAGGTPNPAIVPSAAGIGELGISIKPWNELYVNTAYVNENVCLGASAATGGALQTVVLPNTANMPAGPQANQTYLGSGDFGGGTNLATLSLVTEEPAVLPFGYEIPEIYLPIIWNGTSYYLFAVGPAPA